MGKKRPHPQCSKSCDPRSEGSFVHDGHLSGPPISSNVYMCALGSLHICSKTSCEYYGAQHDQTCHVSGIQHGTVISSYDAGDYRTWRPQIPGGPDALPRPATQVVIKGKTKKGTKRKAPFAQNGEKVLSADAERAESIVVNLLFSPMRTQRNLTATVANRKNAQKAKQGYAYDRKVHHRQLPCLSELHKRGTAALLCELPLKELERDDALVSYYVAVIMQLSAKVRAYCMPKQRMDMDSLALGTLYMLRQGYSHEGRVYLAADAFLDAHLPRINDMIYFAYDRDKITDGMRMLLALYTTTTGTVAPEVLMLDVTQLPERNQVANKLIKL